MTNIFKGKVGIIGGSGHVGLPFGIALAHAGFLVTLIDINETNNTKINNRIMPFIEKSGEDLLKKLKSTQLTATSDESQLEGHEICIIVLGTPSLENNELGSDKLIDIFKTYLSYLENTKLVILRSTVYPGVTGKLKRLMAVSNLKAEIAFCPERLVEGNAFEELSTLPQIIGVDSDVAYEMARDFFYNITSKIVRTTALEAEYVKLFSNAYRYIHFSISNSFLEICIKNGFDWKKIWEALTLDYPRAKSLPKPGFAAGPCLVKDTKQLDFIEDRQFKLGQIAIEINEGLPKMLVENLKQFYHLPTTKFGILGMTFKGNVDDTRDSLAIVLKAILEKESQAVIISDPFLSKTKSIEAEEFDLIQNSDVVIIGAPHNRYADIKIDKPVLDIWRINKNSRSIL